MTKTIFTKSYNFARVAPSLNQIGTGNSTQDWSNFYDHPVLHAVCSWSRFLMIGCRSWGIENCMLKLPVRACNKLPFFKLIKLLKCKQSLHVLVCKIQTQPNIHRWQLYDMRCEDRKFSPKSDIW